MTTEKIQFFMSDLSYKLDIGEIKEIHLAEQNGVKVLRIECEKAGEYKTVRATKSAKTVPVKKVQADKPETFTEKAAAAAKDFFLNPERNKNKPFGGGRF
jgi:hypothetical protein